MNVCRGPDSRGGAQEQSPKGVLHAQRIFSKKWSGVRADHLPLSITAWRLTVAWRQGDGSMMIITLPYVRPGQIVGLLGGSFDPPHAGHVHISREALRRLGLDRVWWLVSPGNPLKERGPAPLERRMAACREIVTHPRIIVTDIEARLGTRFTAETVEALIACYPGVRFVWLMGSDNLAQFDRWQRWQDIMRMVPVCVLARPGHRIGARTARRPASAARTLIGASPPAWVFLNVPMVEASSTAIRARGEW